ISVVISVHQDIRVPIPIDIVCNNSVDRRYLCYSRKLVDFELPSSQILYPNRTIIITSENQHVNSFLFCEKGLLRAHCVVFITFKFPAKHWALSIQIIPKMARKRIE